MEIAMGRKRIGLEPLSPHERAKASREKLLASGGIVASIRISARMKGAIQNICHYADIDSRQKAIEAAIFDYEQKLLKEEEQKRAALEVEEYDYDPEDPDFPGSQSAPVIYVPPQTPPVAYYQQQMQPDPRWPQQPPKVRFEDDKTEIPFR